MPKKRLALIDDHQIVRDGLKALLAKLDNCEVIAEGGSGEDAIRLAADGNIEIFLMDIAMPGMSGLDAAARICEAQPDARIIMLSMHATGEYVRRAMSAGASGYMLKNMAPSELALAIDRVGAGGRYLSPDVSRALEEATQAAENEAGGLNVLTARQQEILRLLAEGMSTRDISEMLSISAKTVETHRSQLMQKLDIFDVPGLVKYAIRHGLVRLE